MRLQSHHGDVEPTTVEAVLVAGRGRHLRRTPRRAPRDAGKLHQASCRSWKRSPTPLTALKRSYAIQAGREVRIIVKPEQVSDADSVLLAKEIVKRIEKELEYPGQIKVNVIRETRATEFAK